MATRIFARWVAAMDGPLISGGVVTIDGDRIFAVGAGRAGVGDVDLGDAVLLPGLVNAHTHLELSHLSPGPRPASFVEWLLGVMAGGGNADAAASMRVGIAECLGFGVTRVGDNTVAPASTRPVLAASPLAGVSYGEVRAMARRRGLLGPRVDAAIAPVTAGRVVAGISPHAPYSIEADGYRACLAAARLGQLPLATHLAETADEAEFLAHQTGPFRHLWAVLDAWDDAVPKTAGGPVRFARDSGLLDYPTNLGHLNYCSDDELKMLAAGRASVVYCPRTHDYFGHPPHRWREMLARGINVAVGTDSRASSPDLNLVDDLRLLQKIAPEMSPLALWEMATVRGAAALCTDGGTIAAGGPADLVAFSTATDDPLREALESDGVPVGVWAAGVRVQG